MFPTPPPLNYPHLLQSTGFFTHPIIHADYPPPPFLNMVHPFFFFCTIFTPSFLVIFDFPHLIHPQFSPLWQPSFRKFVGEPPPPPPPPFLPFYVSPPRPPPFFFTQSPPGPVQGLFKIFDNVSFYFLTNAFLLPHPTNFTGSDNLIWPCRSP